MKYLLSFLLLLPIYSFAQSDSIRLARINTNLNMLVQRDSTFSRTIDVSTGKLALTDLLRNIARVSGVNMSVRDIGGILVSCNFTQTRVDDLIRFLCREYLLDMEVTGNIISIFPATPVPSKQPEPNISYNASDSTLCYDLQNERLIDITKKIVLSSGRNIIVPESLYNYKVSGYVRSMPFNDALQTLAAINNLIAENNTSDVWTLYKEETSDNENLASGPLYQRHRQFSKNELLVDSLGNISAHIAKGNVHDIILDLCEQLKLNYYFISPINIMTGVWVENTDFETLLTVLLSGTEYSYCQEQDIYIFGTTQSKELVSVTIFPFKYRAVSKIEDIVPSAFKQNVELKIFPDQNSLVISGDNRDVVRIETFLKTIDRPVPLITMEIIIADITKSNIREIGIGGGIGQNKIRTSGTLGAGIDMTYSADAVNDLLQKIQGTINLGRVTPNFYLSLQALEENGSVRLQSTPKLSTLNGHEAILTSGETQYYKEVQNNYYGTQNPISSESYQWKSVDANLSIKVTPYVSTDRQITLEIEFEQTEFTGREQEDAPPGTATRSFKSIITVQNEDMVLLGGLDRHTMEKASNGIPFLARVPIIKWLFGKEKRNKIERTLNVFIKPTVIE